jgi:peptide/nickel transport system permease protein
MKNSIRQLIFVAKPKLKEARMSLYLLNRNALTRASLVVMIILLILSIISPYIIPYPLDIWVNTDPANSLQAPSWSHIFGTDELGRDLFSRILYGVKISISTAIIAVGFAVVIGSVLGAIAGTIGGWVDEVIMRICDAFLSFPPLLLAIATSAMLGPSLENAQLSIIISWWPWYTRLLRGQAISVKEKPFVKAAEAIGTKKLRIMFSHIVPNCISPIIIQASMDMGSVILTIASLSFLGLGAQPPTPEWGLMVATGKSYFMNAWWYGIFPGLAIFIAVLTFNLLGDGLREILDPKTRKN